MVRSPRLLPQIQPRPGRPEGANTTVVNPEGEATTHSVNSLAIMIGTLPFGIFLRTGEVPQGALRSEEGACGQGSPSRSRSADRQGKIDPNRPRTTHSHPSELLQRRRRWRHPEVCRPCRLVPESLTLLSTVRLHFTDRQACPHGIGRSGCELSQVSNRAATRPLAISRCMTATRQRATARLNCSALDDH